MSTHGNPAGHEPANSSRQIDAFPLELKNSIGAIGYAALRLEEATTDAEACDWLRLLETACRWYLAERKVDQRKRGREKANGTAPQPADAKGQSKADVTPSEEYRIDSDAPEET